MTVRNRNSVSFRRSVFSCLTAGLRSCPLKNTVLVRHAWAVSIPMGAAQNPQLLAIYSWVPNSAHPERGSSCRAREYVVPSRWRQGVAGDRTRGERRPEGRTPEGGQCRCDDWNRGAQVVAKRCERGVVEPTDFAHAMDADPLARAAYDRLSYSRKREHVRAIESAKKPETRLRRIEAAMAKLRDPESKKA